jgi:hypothetical protein
LAFLGIEVRSEAPNRLSGRESPERIPVPKKGSPVPIKISR